MIEQINGILSASALMLGGALIIFIYAAYRETRQKSLLLLTLGLFILIIGSVIPSFLLLIVPGRIDLLVSLTISLCIQIPGILVMMYSALRG
jgi:hypothetical protein